MNEFEQRVVLALEDIARELAEGNALLGSIYDDSPDDPGLQVPGHPVGDLVDFEPIRSITPRGFTADGYDPDSDPTDLPEEERQEVEERVQARRRRREGRTSSGGTQAPQTASYGVLGVARRGCLGGHVEELREYARTHTYKQTHAHATQALGLEVGYWAIRDLIQGRTYKTKEDQAIG